MSNQTVSLQPELVWKSLQAKYHEYERGERSDRKRSELLKEFDAVTRAIIPTKENRSNEALINIWIHLAKLKSETSEEDGITTFKVMFKVHKIGLESAAVYVAWADLEFAQGNTEKGLTILEKAIKIKAKPTRLLEEACKRHNQHIYDLDVSRSATIEYTDEIQLHKSGQTTSTISMVDPTPSKTLAVPSTPTTKTTTLTALSSSTTMTPGINKSLLSATTTATIPTTIATSRTSLPTTSTRTTSTPAPVLKTISFAVDTKLDASQTPVSEAASRVPLVPVSENKLNNKSARQAAQPYPKDEKPRTRRSKSGGGLGMRRLLSFGPARRVKYEEGDDDGEPGDHTDNTIEELRPIPQLTESDIKTVTFLPPQPVDQLPTTRQSSSPTTVTAVVSSSTTPPRADDLVVTSKQSTSEAQTRPTNGNTISPPATLVARVEISDKSKDEDEDSDIILNFKLRKQSLTSTIKNKSSPIATATASNEQPTAYRQLSSEDKQPLKQHDTNNNDNNNSNINSSSEAQRRDARVLPVSDQDDEQIISKLKSRKPPQTPVAAAKTTLPQQQQYNVIYSTSNSSNNNSNSNSNNNSTIGPVFQKPTQQNSLYQQQHPQQPMPLSSMTPIQAPSVAASPMVPSSTPHYQQHHHHPYSLMAPQPSPGHGLMMPPPSMMHPPPSEVLYVNGVPYTKIETIGRGGSSKVFKVMSPSRKICALKRVRLQGAEQSTLQGFINEITLLKRLRGKPNIIQLIDSEINCSANVLYMVMEIGELDFNQMLVRQSKLHPGRQLLNENQLRLYWQQMLEAVHTVHEERIVHGDLKPANFLFVEGNIKLIDFGIAKTIQNDTTNIVRDNQIGTINYISPEALIEAPCDEFGRPTRKFKLGRASDIWSLGCILYQMVYGRPPFAHLSSNIQKMQCITNDRFEIPFPPIANKDLLDTLKRCLRRNPSERPSIPDLLRHPFLNPTAATAVPSSIPANTDERLQDLVTQIVSTLDIDNKSEDAIANLKEVILKKIKYEREQQLVSVTR